MSSSLQLANLFETPVILDTLARADDLNRELKTVIATQRQRSPGVRKSNWNGWQSETDMLAWGGAPAAELADHFLRLCDGFTSITDPTASHAGWLWRPRRVSLQSQSLGVWQRTRAREASCRSQWMSIFG